MSKNINCDFASHELLITKGEQQSLKGWWKAADECRRSFRKENGSPNVSLYAKAAGKVANDNTEDTIRKYVGYCIKAQDAGYKMSEFKGIMHLRETMCGLGNRAVVEKQEPKSIRFSAQRKEEIASILRRAKVSDAEIASLFAFGTLGNK
jgi:hypothetical protein